MEQIILSDSTEFIIKEGASIHCITIVTDDFTTLGTIATALKQKGNLDNIQFKTNGNVTGVYTNMKLITPLFHSVDINSEGKIEAIFSISEKTDIEKRLDNLESGQEIQDGAIIELASIVAEEGV